MNPKDFRIKFRETFGKWFRVDKWALGMPEPRSDKSKPPSVAREIPITEIETFSQILGYTDKFHCKVHQKFSYQILYRLPNTLNYDQVFMEYRSDLENTVCLFSAFIQRSPGCLACDEIKQVKTKVSSPELKQGDWLLSAQIEGIAIYISDNVTDPVDARFTLRPLL